MSTLLLAPFNDSMRLGQGYNSFLHTPCLANAVDISNATFVETTGGEVPSQTVSYSARFVEKMSDVVRAMNISAGSSIRAGSVSVSGGGNNIDEIKFAESDLNAVISVKVVNQTRHLRDNISFKGLDIAGMNESKFHDIYGDAFISGFIQGGDLHGIISIKTIDSSKKTEIKNKLRSQFNGKKSEWSPSSSLALNEALSETEVTVTVNWSGGGVIKPPNEEWTIDSLIRASSSFADNVAKCPQRTWAILTSYDTVPDFVVWAFSIKPDPIKVKRYDGVQRLTSDLLDMYIEYKGSLVILNDAIRHPDRYEASTYTGGIKMDLNCLIAARKDLRAEMNKIVDKIEELDRNPVGSVKAPKKKDVEAAEASKVEPPKEQTTEEQTPKKDDGKAKNTVEADDVEAPELWRAKLPFRKDTAGDVAKHDILERVLLGLPFHKESKDGSSGKYTLGCNSEHKLHDKLRSALTDLGQVKPDSSQIFHHSTIFGSVAKGDSFDNTHFLDPSMNIRKIEGSSYNGYMRHLRIEYTNNHEDTFGTAHSGDRFFEFTIDTANQERIVQAEIQVGTWRNTKFKRVGEISLVTNLNKKLEWQTAEPVDPSAEKSKPPKTSTSTEFKPEFKSESYAPPPKKLCIKGFWGLSKKGTEGGDEDGIWRLGVIWESEPKVVESAK